MEQFNADRPAMLERAKDAGVESILAIGSGTGPGSLDCAIHLATQNHGIYASIGIHPHEAKLATDADFDELDGLAKSEHVIAWGEIGLDYYYDHSPRDVQKDVFLRQMRLAAQNSLPIIIHCRPSNESDDAWADTIAILREHWAPTNLGGILHMAAALEMGFMISFSGNVTFPKAQDIRDAAKQVPLDRMLIETDSPFLAPVPNRGKRNEPAFVVNVAEKIAEVRGMTAASVAAATTQNFYRFFGLHEKIK
jgi:TatD DNase family protein